MTIIMVVKRRDFAIIAADTLAVTINVQTGVERHLDYRQKIVLHPTLPLALATSGLVAAPRGRVDDYVRDVVSRFTRRSLSQDGVMRPLRAKLHPFIHKTRTDLPPELKTEARLTAYAAWVRNGKAELAKMTLRSGTELFAPLGDLHLGDRHQTIHDGGPYTDLQKLYATGVTDQLALAEHCRTVLNYYIEGDRELHGGVNRRIGGEVDVVLVHAGGAHLVPPPQSSREPTRPKTSTAGERNGERRP